ncbi:hypothetical protein [Flavilitoribacter nigricans]|nr:hypothetical protein [Flavilitoribacter nigricans]
MTPTSRSILALLVLITCTHCVQKDPVSTGPEVLLSINVPEDYHRTQEGYADRSFAYITDETGTVIDAGELLDGTLLKLSGNYDHANRPMHAHIVRVYYRFQGSHRSERYTVDSYSDIEPDTWDLERRPLPNRQELNLKFINTGGEIEQNEHFVDSNTYGSGSESDGDNGTYFRTILVDEFPEDVYIAFKRKNESGVRYFWQRVSGPESQEINSLDLPLIEKPVSISVPPAAGGYVAAYGYKADAPAQEKEVFYHHLEGGANSVSPFVPAGVFDYFRNYCRIGIFGKGFYGITEIGPLRTDYQLPELDLMVHLTDVKNLEFEAGRPFDGYDISARYLERGPDRDQLLVWSVRGTYAAKINPPFPELPDLITEALPFVESHLPDLELDEATVFTYQDFPVRRTFFRESVKFGGLSPADHGRRESYTVTE